MKTSREIFWNKCGNYIPGRIHVRRCHVTSSDTKWAKFAKNYVPFGTDCLGLGFTKIKNRKIFLWLNTLGKESSDFEVMIGGNKVFIYSWNRQDELIYLELRVYWLVDVAPITSCNMRSTTKLIKMIVPSAQNKFELYCKSHTLRVPTTPHWNSLRDG